MARQICAVPVCPATARRYIAATGERYCLACAASVEQAAYMQSLPAKSAEHVLFRHSFATEPPAGVTIPEPLAMFSPPSSAPRVFGFRGCRR
jgi:hypothetical protein